MVGGKKKTGGAGLFHSNNSQCLNKIPSYWALTGRGLGLNLLKYKPMPLSNRDKINPVRRFSEGQKATKVEKTARKDAGRRRSHCY